LKVNRLQNVVEKKNGVVGLPVSPITSSTFDNIDCSPNFCKKVDDCVINDVVSPNFENNTTGIV
jgi:hypothetical protein